MEPMVSGRRARAILAATILFAAICGAANAAVPVAVRVVQTDLKPLIRAAYQTPVQFAVFVPHAASTARDGQWTTEGNRAVWRYAVEVPTAISMSFHATRSSLPAGASLIVSGEKTTASYGASDLHHGDLWSRIYPGAALQLTLSVPTGVRFAMGHSAQHLLHSLGRRAQRWLGEHRVFTRHYRGVQPTGYDVGNLHLYVAVLGRPGLPAAERHGDL